jgi:hypothetical protein
VGRFHAVYTDRDKTAGRQLEYPGAKRPAGLVLYIQLRQPDG